MEKVLKIWGGGPKGWGVLKIGVVPKRGGIVNGGGGSYDCRRVPEIGGRPLIGGGSLRFKGCPKVGGGPQISGVHSGVHRWGGSPNVGFFEGGGRVS